MHGKRGNFCIFLLKIAEKEGKSASLTENVAAGFEAGLAELKMPLAPAFGHNNDVAALFREHLPVVRVLDRAANLGGDHRPAASPSAFQFSPAFSPAQGASNRWTNLGIF